MLEFKNALISLGFQVEALRLTANELANIQVPIICLMLPYENIRNEPESAPIGHYLVLWPLNEESFEILDYPRKPLVVPRNYWIRHLRNIGTENIPVLLCDTERQALEKSLLTLEITNK